MDGDTQAQLPGIDGRTGLGPRPQLRTSTVQVPAAVAQPWNCETYSPDFCRPHLDEEFSGAQDEAGIGVTHPAGELSEGARIARVRVRAKEDLPCRGAVVEQVYQS